MFLTECFKLGHVWSLLWSLKLNFQQQSIHRCFYRPKSVVVMQKIAHGLCCVKCRALPHASTRQAACLQIWDKAEAVDMSRYTNSDYAAPVKKITDSVIAEARRADVHTPAYIGRQVPPRTGVPVPYCCVRPQCHIGQLCHIVQASQRCLPRSRTGQGVGFE